MAISDATNTSSTLPAMAVNTEKLLQPTSALALIQNNPSLALYTLFQWQLIQIITQKPNRQWVLHSFYT